MIRRQRDASLAIAMVDVDGLKAANDTYGHQIGDAVLVLVAQKLTRDGAIVGRYGGDEFVGDPPGRGPARRPSSTATDVLASLAGAGLTDEQTGARVPVVASIGLAMYPEEAEAVDDLIRLSDSAMYASRRQRVGGRRRDVARGRWASDRAAKMVGEIVPLLTSPGSAGRQAAAGRAPAVGGRGLRRRELHRRGAGAGAAGVVERVRARAEADDLEEWNRRQLRRPTSGGIASLLVQTMQPDHHRRHRRRPSCCRTCSGPR